MKTVKKYTVKRYCSDDFALWNDFISQATNATFLFDRNFMEYHADRFQDFSLLVFEEDILQAVVPANCKDNQIFSHQGLTYGGFVFRNEFPLGQIEAVLSETFNFLQSQGFVLFVIKAMLPFYATDFLGEMQQVLSNKQAEIIGRKMNFEKQIETLSPIAIGRFGGEKRGRLHCFLARSIGTFIVGEIPNETFTFVSWN